MKDFLKKFNISLENYEKTGLEWEKLMVIKKDFEEYCLELEPPAKYLIERFHKAKNVHSVRYRIKDPEHLVAKIIRKKIDEPERDITIDNYRTEITDLIGIRILHLFKDDWIQINEFITKNWQLYEDTTAYHREGDSAEYIEYFEKNNCKVKIHPFGYRSVHYLIKTQPSKELYIAEIQVRTIFEEAWSEIDHKVRYPYDMDNKLLSQFLVIFNRLAGSSDEMGSFVKYLKNELTEKERIHLELMMQKNIIIDELKEKINKLEIEPKVISGFETTLEKIRALSNRESFNMNFEIPDMSNFKIPTLEDFAFNIEMPKIDLSSYPIKPIDTEKLKKGISKPENKKNRKK